jgi:hypothetical protein
VNVNQPYRKIFLEYQGELLTLKQISERTGIKPITLYARLKTKKPLEQVFFLNRLPGSGQGRKPCIALTVDGVTSTIREWSDKTGLPQQTIGSRLRRGLSDAEAVKPVTQGKAFAEKAKKPARQKRTRQDSDEAREWVRQAKTFMKGEAKKFIRENAE